MKHCPHCDRVKAPTEFGKNRATPDGLAYYCRDCQAEKARQWRAEHPKEAKAIKTRYVASLHERNRVRAIEDEAGADHAR